MKQVNALTAVVLLAASLARGATVTWLPTGGINDWFVETNWDSGTWPTNADEVIITNANALVLLTNSTAPLASFLMSNNCTLLFSNWNTALRATNVYLNGGTLTHTDNSATTTNGAGEWVPDARVWIVCSNLTIATGAVVTCGGGLLLTNAALTLYAGTGVNVGATVNVGGGMTLTTNSALYVYNGETNTPGIPVWSAAINVTGDVTIASNAWIYAFSHRTNGGSARFRMASLDIAAGGGINANGRGYGHGGSTGSGPGWTSPDGRGAGHGGRGGGSSPGGGSTYGDSNAPIAAGSSGQRQSSSLVGTGGGVIWIEAAQNVKVDGSLRAYGVNASGNVGGGGGGRIAVWRMYHESTVSNDVTAGSGFGVAAEDGTVVWGWFPVPGTVFTIH